MYSRIQHEQIDCFPVFQQPSCMLVSTDCLSLLIIYARAQQITGGIEEGEIYSLLVSPGLLSVVAGA